SHAVLRTRTFGLNLGKGSMQAIFRIVVPLTVLCVRRYPPGTLFRFGDRGLHGRPRPRPNHQTMGRVAWALAEIDGLGPPASSGSRPALRCSETRTHPLIRFAQGDRTA